MATNTAALKTFAQQTRAKLVSLVSTKMRYVLNSDTAEIRGYERQIGELQKQIQTKTEKIVIEEIAYTWFNRVMALRFMDANGYNAPMVITPAAGQTRPEILQDAMSGNVDDELMLTPEERLLPEAKLYRKLLVAVCNKKMSIPMPFLFEHIADYTELLLPDDLLSEQSFVSDIRKGMTDEDCQNVEIIGWLYQFYITDRKADAESKKSKKGGLKSDEQAAATQLFTPHWIVRYMVENSLGRIWITLHPESSLINEMPYYIATPEGQTDIIPEDIHSARDIRFLDPCVGSGHILVYAFDLFCKMYEEEGEQAKDIPALILENNLYGIDIDRRCYQLACFALTMKARAYYRRYLRHTVNPHIIALAPINHDTIESTGVWPSKSLMWQFEKVDTIGSLLKVTPEECDSIKVSSGLFGEQQRLLKIQAEYLSRLYHCVVTNPPYLGKGIGNYLKDYLQNVYPDSKYDTMATFMERCSDFCPDFGKISMINMRSWMFISTYKRLREHIVNDFQIDSLLHLGPHAFNEIGGEIVQCATFVIAKHSPQNGFYCDLTSGNSSEKKESDFLYHKSSHSSPIIYDNVEQSVFTRIPDMTLAFWASNKTVETFKYPLLGSIARPRIGQNTGDNNRFLRLWFEVSFDKVFLNLQHKDLLTKKYKWLPYNKGGEFRRWYGNQDYIINWENDGKEIKEFAVIRNHGKHWSRYIQNIENMCKPGITWSFISSSNFAVRYLPNGFICDVAGSAIFPTDYFESLNGILNSKFAGHILQILNPTNNTQAGDLVRIPIMPEILNNDEIIKLVSENVNISKLDWDHYETSWDFQINPIVSIARYNSSTPSNYNLSVLIQQLKDNYLEKFNRLRSNEIELNKIITKLYELDDELDSQISINDISLLQKGEISFDNNLLIWHEDEFIKQLISYLVGCFMGRFSIDKPGLIIASQGQKVEDLDLPIRTIELDDDGIIPIIQEEDFFTDDMTQRIKAAIKTLFGEENYYDNIKYIKAQLGQDLRDYLFKNYYNDHQQMYSVKGAKRPIYWLFSSQMGDKKKKGYFKALVYMHRLEADTLSKLHADYVHPYIQKIEQQLVEAEDNATRDDLSQAQHNKALKLADVLRDKVREVKNFETALVEMASARVNIDLDDGVKNNYPKFYPLVEPIKGFEKSNN